MDNFGNLSISLFSCLFCNEPEKKMYGVRTLTAEPPPPIVRASTPLARPLLLPPSKRTHFMDDPALIMHSY